MNIKRNKHILSAHLIKMVLSVTLKKKCSCQAAFERYFATIAWRKHNRETSVWLYKKRTFKGWWCGGMRKLLTSMLLVTDVLYETEYIFENNTFKTVFMSAILRKIERVYWNITFPIYLYPITHLFTMSVQIKRIN